METAAATLSMLIGMASGLIQAFDIPVVCPSLSDWASRGRVEAALPLDVPLGDLLTRDWGGACAARNGITSLPYFLQDAPQRRV